MVLHVDSDATYLVLTKAKSWIARYYFLSEYPNRDTRPSLNRVILVECKDLCHVVSLSTKVEIVSIFYNTQTAIPIWYILKVIGH